MNKLRTITIATLVMLLIGCTSDYRSRMGSAGQDIKIFAGEIVGADYYDEETK